MNTTTITATGINGQRITKELPAEGEIVVITTGNPRVGIRHTVAKVTGFTTRSITGTGYAYYVTVAVAADGQELTDSRVRPATDEEIAQYQADTTPAEVPFEIVSEEEAAFRTHSAQCLTCRYFGQTGRACHQGRTIWEAAHRARHDLTRAPIIIENRWGVRSAHWDATLVIGKLDHAGDRLIQAPAGMIEAGRRELARQRKASAERLAARRASGRRRR